MTKLIQIISIIIFFSCSNKTNENIYKQPSKNEVDEIIDVVIKSDSIFPKSYLIREFPYYPRITKVNFDTISVCKYLLDIKTVNQSKKKLPPKPLYLEINIQTLLILL